MVMQTQAMVSLMNFKGYNEDRQGETSAENARERLDWVEFNDLSPR